ncbi:MarR family transcriptional regulator [Hydrogenophaga sp. 5NK40-0174]|uniref:MarR family transcriptional regulator n=1 Tax=Hydrogenophaga sp. 5NK40-0174 TaxID=3127649 RepID=UPI0031027FB9
MLMRARESKLLQASQLADLGVLLQRHVLAPARGGQSQASAEILMGLLRSSALTVTALARVSDLSQPACTRALDRLEADGKIKRLAKGRTTLVRLTAKGTRQATSIQRKRLSMAVDFIDLLSPAERKCFGSVLDKWLACEANQSPDLN